MKTVKNIFDEKCTYENIYKAYRMSRQSKRKRSEVLKFEIHENSYVSYLYETLKSGEYKIGEYREFVIYEPKRRVVLALPFMDRVVQRWFCDNILKGIIDPKLDYDNAACRICKGTHFALNRIKKFLKEYYKENGSSNEGYFLKCDITHYFDNINHKVLKSRLYKYIKDKKVLALLDEIIDSTDGDVGLPLGNITSQWFAIFYLDRLDKFVREELKIKYYSRYMDDFVLIHKDKEYLKECLAKIKTLLWEELGLTLNKKTQIIKMKNGLDYVGFHTYLTSDGKIIRKIRKRSKQKMKVKVKHFNNVIKECKENDYDISSIDAEKMLSSLTSWQGHIRHGNTYYIDKKLKDLSKEIYEIKEYKDEKENFKKKFNRFGYYSSDMYQSFFDKRN